VLGLVSGDGKVSSFVFMVRKRMSPGTRKRRTIRKMRRRLSQQSSKRTNLLQRSESLKRLRLRKKRVRRNEEDLLLESVGNSELKILQLSAFLGYVSCSGG
jgi:hypothetical protein